MTRSLLSVLALAILSAGCNLLNDFTSPTSTNNPTTDSFSGSLPVSGSNVSTYTVTQSGTVNVTLTTLSTTVPVGLGVGTPNGTTCQLATSSSNVTAASTPQITVTEDAGSHCIEVYDVGTLTGAATYTVTVSHP